MSGVSYFNGGASSNSSGSPYPKLKASPNPFTTNLFGGVGSFVNQVAFLHYAYRSGVGNRGLKVLGQTSVSLIEVQADGTRTTITNFDPTSYLPNAAVIAPSVICYSTVDQCWYILLTYVNPPHCRLIKVNDTTGAVTAIGSAFNPANPNSTWPSLSLGHTITSFYLDNTTGHLKVICNGYYHLLNKATGAIVSQDTPLVVTGGVYSPRGCGYITQNGNLAIGSVSASSLTTDSFSISRMVGRSGQIGFQTFQNESLSFPSYKVNKLNYIDHDKIYVGQVDDISGVALVVTVSDYDAFLEAVYDYNV